MPDPPTISAAGPPSDPATMPAPGSSSDLAALGISGGGTDALSGLTAPSGGAPSLVSPSGPITSSSPSRLDPLSGLAGNAGAGVQQPHRTLNTVLRGVAFALAGAAAGGGAKRPGEAAAAGLQTGIGLAERAKQNERADTELQSKVKFQNIQAAELAARTAMYDKQLHQMDQQFQDEHNARTLAQMKELQAMGITPTIVADNHGRGANAALEQLTASHGGVPAMFALNLGDKIVGYDMKQLGGMSAMREQVNAIAKIQGKGDEAYSASLWGMLSPEARTTLLQQSLSFFNPMPTKENVDNQLQQYKNWRQSYALNPSADKGTLDKLDGTVKMLEDSRATFVKQKAEEAGQQAAAVQAATLPGDIKKAVTVASAEEPIKVATALAIKKATGGGDPVYAFDPTSQKTILTNKGDAQDRGLQGIRKVSEADISKDTHDIKVLNDIVAKANSVYATAGSMDKNDWKDTLGVARYLAEHPGTTMDGLTKSAILKNVSPKVKNYAINVMSLRESAMGMQKVLTGSARTSETQLTALLATLPGVEPDAATVRQKLGAFTQNLGVLRQGLPELPGMETIKIAGEGGGAGNIPVLQAGFTRIKASDGSSHDVPTANLAGAKKIDPNLQVIESK